MIKLNADAKLILSGPCTQKGNDLRLIKAGKTINISAPGRFLTDMLFQLDGQKNLEQITASLSQKYDRDSVSRFLLDLVEQEIIVDASRFIEFQWDWVSNPYSRLRLENGNQAEDSQNIENADDLIPLKVTNDPFLSFLEKRKSIRQFSSEPLDQSQIANLLYAAYGYINQTGRSVPSGGGFYPLSIGWVQLKAVPSLPEGIYEVRYRPGKEVFLQKISDIGHAFIRSLGNPGSIVLAQGVLVIRADFSAQVPKYGNRSTLLSILEAGHVAQNVQLYAAQAGIGALCYCGFEEAWVKKFTDDSSHMPLLMIPVGKEDKDFKAGNDAPVISFNWVDYSDSGYETDYFVGRTEIQWLGVKSGICGGRSCDAKMAYNKALSEAVERISCKLPEGLTKARAKDLTNHLYPSLFLEYTALKSGKKSAFPFKPFQEDGCYEWVTVHRYGTDMPHYMLSDLVYYGCPKAPDINIYATGTTSGVAAYTDLEGAKEKALLELVERHCFMSLWLSGNSGTIIEKTSLPLELQDKILYLREKGWETYILDMGCAALPCILTIMQNGVLGRTIMGASCHYDVSRAVLSSFMEVEASLAFVTHENEPSLHPRDVQTPENHGDIYKMRKYFRKADRLFQGSRKCNLSDLKASVLDFCELARWLEENGHLLYYLDMTPYEANITDLNRSRIYVARMMAESLIPITFGYGMESVFKPSRLCPEHILDKKKVNGFLHPFN
jgi:ribosomal protein S12 methylthiotransferase accessory factor